MSDNHEPPVPVDQPCAAPDLNPHQPSFILPPGACDCHAHIFGDPARYPYKTVRRYTPSAATVDDYRHMLQVLGIERAVIVQTGIFHGNDVTYDVLKESGGHWRGIALLDGSVTTQEVARLNDAGFRGVRLNPRNVKADDLKDMETIAQKIAPFGWHLQFHLDARDLVTMADRLRKLPVDIVVDHLGHMPVDAGIDHPGFQELLALLREGRTWVKLSSPNRFGDPRPPYPSVTPYARALIDAAPQRCVWASDWPHSRFAGYMPNDGDLLNLLAEWVPDEAVRNRILVDNPARLYGFPQAGSRISTFDQPIIAAASATRESHTMQYDWSTLGSKAPTALVKARSVAHLAAQWPTKAARANLDALPDDSHSSLVWDGERGALFSQSIPAGGADVRVGLRLAGLALILMRGNLVLDTYELAGRRDSMVGVWLDSALRALGLKAATTVTLPYTLPSHPVARGSAYSFNGELEAFDEIVNWFDAGADLLAEVRAGYTDAQPGAALCWPHHFDLATLVSFDVPGTGNARSIGIGLSPGDHYYPQPYVYVSPWPQLNAAALSALPPPGHWHTQGFTGAVATGEAIIALEDRRAAVLDFVRAAYDIGRAQFGVASAPPVNGEESNDNN